MSEKAIAKHLRRSLHRKAGGRLETCLECGKYVRRPQTKVCPGCQHEFQKKDKGDSKIKTAHSPAFHSTSVESALLYVLRAGGMDKARKGIEGLKSNPCMEFAISCGGVDAALKKLAEVESKIG